MSYTSWKLQTVRVCVYRAVHLPSFPYTRTTSSLCWRYVWRNLCSEYCHAHASTLLRCQVLIAFYLISRLWYENFHNFRCARRDNHRCQNDVRITSYSVSYSLPWERKCHRQMNTDDFPTHRVRSYIRAVQLTCAIRKLLCEALSSVGIYKLAFLCDSIDRLYRHIDIAWDINWDERLFIGLCVILCLCYVVLRCSSVCAAHVDENT